MFCFLFFFFSFSTEILYLRHWTQLVRSCAFVSKWVEGRDRGEKERDKAEERKKIQEYSGELKRDEEGNDSQARGFRSGTWKWQKYEYTPFPYPYGQTKILLELHPLLSLDSTNSFQMVDTINFYYRRLREYQSTRFSSLRFSINSQLSIFDKGRGRRRRKKKETERGMEERTGERIGKEKEGKI